AFDGAIHVCAAPGGLRRSFDVLVSVLRHDGNVQPRLIDRKHLIIPAEPRPQRGTPAINTHAPSAANSAAATIRTALNGMRSAARCPARAVGTLTINMPSVVPTTTAASESKRAASTTVAICVLSPISARKKALV